MGSAAGAAALELELEVGIKLEVELIASISGIGCVTESISGVGCVTERQLVMVCSIFVLHLYGWLNLCAPSVWLMTLVQRSRRCRARPRN
jgi:hypothetical protein